MNRYTVQGIADDLESEKTIVILTSSYNTAQNIMYQLLEYADETYADVRGKTIIGKFGGGVFIVTDEAQARGMVMDVYLHPRGMDRVGGLGINPRAEIIEY